MVEYCVYWLENGEPMHEVFSSLAAAEMYSCAIRGKENIEWVEVSEEETIDLDELEDMFPDDFCGVYRFGNAFAEGWVRVQRHCQLRFGQPSAYGRNHFANHIGGAAAHQLRADEFFRFCVKHQLNKAAVLVFDNGFAVAAHNVFSSNNGTPLRFGFVCRNANRGNFGRSIYARRHKVCVNRRRKPADAFHATTERCGPLPS